MSRLLENSGVDLSREIEQVLDELFDAIVTSIYKENGSALCAALSQRLEHGTRERYFTWRPLVDFWEAVAKLADLLDQYIIPRFDRLAQSACALEPLGCIIGVISGRSWDQLPVVFQKVVDVLITIGHTGGLFRAAYGMNSSGWLMDSTGEAIYHLTSFRADDAGQEHIRMLPHVFMALLRAAANIQDDCFDLWSDFIK